MQLLFDLMELAEQEAFLLATRFHRPTALVPILIIHRETI